MHFKRLKRFKPGRPTLIIVGALVLVVILISTRSNDEPEPRRALEDRIGGVTCFAVNKMLEKIDKAGAEG